MQIPGRPVLAKPEACRTAAPASLPVSARAGSLSLRVLKEEPAAGETHVRVRLAGEETAKAEAECENPVACFWFFCFFNFFVFCLDVPAGK